MRRIGWIRGGRDISFMETESRDHKNCSTGYHVYCVRSLLACCASYVLRIESRGYRVEYGDLPSALLKGSSFTVTQLCTVKVLLDLRKLIENEKDSGLLLNGKSIRNKGQKKKPIQHTSILNFSPLAQKCRSTSASSAHQSYPTPHPSPLPTTQTRRSNPPSEHIPNPRKKTLTPNLKSPKLDLAHRKSHSP